MRSLDGLAEQINNLCNQENAALLRKLGTREYQDAHR